MDLASIVLNLLAGLCLLAFWYAYALVLPFSRLSEGIRDLALHPEWPLINLLGVAGTVLASAGLISESWARPLGGVGSVGVLFAIVGLQLLGANLAWESIIWPVLALRHPSVVRFDGPLYSSRLLLGFFTVAGLAFSAGYVLLAVAVWDISPWVGLGFGLGAPLFAIGSLLGRFQAVVRSVGITVLAASQAVFGFF